MEKKIICILCSSLLLFYACNTTGNSSGNDTKKAIGAVPFSKGVNINFWFEALNAKEINFGRFIEQDFIEYKKLGVDVIRLPINMHNMTLGLPDYIIDPLLFELLDKAVDLAEKNQIYIIIDNHSWNGNIHIVPHVDNYDIKMLKAVWPQIAEHFKNRSEYVLYEIRNEANGISANSWGKVQGEILKLIRQKDVKHTVIVGGTNWNKVDGLLALPKYNDNNIIYTFHFYEPELFVRQGTKWEEESHFYEFVTNIPYPYSREKMPLMPKEVKGTWAEEQYKNYHKDGSLVELYKKLDQVAAFSRKVNAPVFCGEFGSSKTISHEERVNWYKFINEAFNERNISWTIWSATGDTDIFNTPLDGDFRYYAWGDINSNLNIEIAEALGFTPPQQIQPSLKPRIGFTIYDDYLSRGFRAWKWPPEKFLDLFNSNAVEGKYSICWGNANRYDSFQISFCRILDFSYLVQNGYYLEFKARTEKPVSFEARFINFESTASIPWRARYIIDNNILPPDGKWHTIRIPLGNMQDVGAWSNLTKQYLAAKNQYSWSKVVELAFSADQEALINKWVWFDEIKITR